MYGHQGTALLPTPQFLTPLPAGYQPNMGLTNAGHQPAMFHLPPMYPYIPFPMPQYGYHTQMAHAARSQQQATMIRSQIPMNAETIFTPPNPMVSMTIPDMTSFPGPHPVPVSLDDRQFNEVKPEIKYFGFEVPDEIEVEDEQPQEVEKFEEEDVAFFPMPPYGYYTQIGFEVPGKIKVPVKKPPVKKDASSNTSSNETSEDKSSQKTWPPDPSSCAEFGSTPDGVSTMQDLQTIFSLAAKISVLEKEKADLTEKLDDATIHSKRQTEVSL